MKTSAQQRVADTPRIRIITFHSHVRISAAPAGASYLGTNVTKLVVNVGGIDETVN